MTTRLVAGAVLLALGCGGTSLKEATPLPPLTAAPLTTEQTIVLSHAAGTEPAHSPSDPAGLLALLAAGWGDTMIGAGVSIVPHTLTGVAPPTAGAAPRLLIRFGHLADAQLADDESPARLASFDAMGPTNSAYRPQEAWGCRMLNAAARTFNKIHETRPIELVILGGDNIDNAQGNELDWFTSILDGSPLVECDSGDDDDPVPGPDNDPKDPFFADGLVMPWRWVTGNHDLLFQGSLPIADRRSEYTSDMTLGGTRQWTSPEGPLTTGPIVADARRVSLLPTELLDRVAGRADGHGVTAAARASGRAFYSFDSADSSVRFVAVDTSVAASSSDGAIRRADLEGLVRPLLQQAEADGKWIIVLSHHAASSLGGPTNEGESISPQEWRDFLGSFPRVVLHLGAHSHRFGYRVAQPTTGHAYFEAETASLLDWPDQTRLFEVWDQDNGFLSIRGVPIDYAIEGDPTLAEARRRAAADYAAGWVTAGPGDPEARAIELYFPKP